MSTSDIPNPCGLDDLMAIHWRDFIIWAQSEKGLVAQFNSETGRRYMEPRSPEAALIDRAAGKEADDTEAFVEWVTVNWWGLDEAPAAYREHLAAKKAETSP